MHYALIIICTVFVAYIIAKDILQAKERERIILMLLAEASDISKIVTPPKKEKPSVKKPRKRVFGEVRIGGDNK